jgi:hypothetical protein
MKNKSSIILALIFIAIAGNATPPNVKAPKLKRYGMSVGASTIFSIFKVDTRMSEKAYMKPGGSAFIKYNYYATSNVHLQVGVEMMTQSCKFNTYYFAPGYSQYYDLSYQYSHTLRTLEFYLPITCRIGNAVDENNSQTIYFVTGGYSPKLFVSSSTNVENKTTGKGIWGGETTLAYEHHFLGLQTGNCLLLGTGIEKRLGISEKFISFEMIFLYNLSRFKYSGRMGQTNTNDLMLKNSVLKVQIGYRF